jgi:hypothetical protein
MQGKKRSVDKKADQLQRFREAAKQVEADESGKEFDRALTVITGPKRRLRRKLPNKTV